MQTQTTLSTVTRGGNRHSHGGRAPTRDVRTDAKQPSQHDRPTRHLFRASPPIRNPSTAQGKPTLHSLVCTTIKGVVSPDTAETALDRRRKPSSLRLRHIARKISLAKGQFLESIFFFWKCLFSPRRPLSVITQPLQRDLLVFPRPLTTSTLVWAQRRQCPYDPVAIPRHCVIFALRRSHVVNSTSTLA